MKVKEDSKIAGLKLNIQKTKIMASSPITSWHIDGETMATVRNFNFGAPKSLQMVTAAMKLKDACSLGEKIWQPKQHVKKQTHYQQRLSSQSYGFSSSHVGMAIKKAEGWRIVVFELWCWRRLLRVPWTARRSNQSIGKEISPEYSLEGLMLTLKLQYFGHWMGRTASLEKTPMLGKAEGRRRRDDRGWDGWMASPMRWTWVWAGSGSWWRDREVWRAAVHGVSQRVGHDWATELNILLCVFGCTYFY